MNYHIKRRSPIFPLPALLWPGALTVGSRCVWQSLWFVAMFLTPLTMRPAEVNEVWVQRFNAPVTNSINQALKVVTDANGDIVVTGTTDDHTHIQDFLTVKYSGTTGAVLWQQRHTGPGNASGTPFALALDAVGDVIVAGFSGGSFYTAKYAAANGAVLWDKRTNGVAQSVVVATNGDVFVTGYTGGSSSDYYTAKYAAADGVLLWDRKYSFSTNSDDRAVAVALDANGNPVVTGISTSSIYTVKYAAADGALLWQSRGTNATLRAMVLDPLGNPLLTGYTTTTGRDFYTAKFSGTNGAFIWETRYNGPAGAADEGRAIAVDASGNVAVTGTSSGNSTTDYYTAKYAGANGARLWEKRYNGPANSSDIAMAVVVDSAGNVIVTGSSDGLTNGVSTSSDYYTAKYAAADGALLWEQRADKPNSYGESARDVVIDSSGNVIVTGTLLLNTGSPEFYTVKYAGTNGLLLLEMRYGAIGNTGEEGRAVAFDPSGNVLVTGFANNNSLVPHFYTAKYAAANGALLWEQRSADTNGSKDFAYDVAVDANGNAIVTGVSYNGSNRDYYTAKYAAANGALLWERRYDGPLASADEPVAVALDTNGNAIVTGFSTGLTSNRTSQDFYTAKYAAADGALLWETRYNGPTNLSEAATDVAVDAAGNAVVTGRSYNGSNYDFYTAKYAAANGALLWERRYNGAANRDDIPAAVAIDSNGNVAVAGYSANVSGDDYYTAKYAAADGALLWEARYNNPSNEVDHATAIAVDGDGNVVVTGSSRNASGSSGNILTAKYAAATGLLLWEHRYDGPQGNGNDATGVAVDNNGDVVVTGTSQIGTTTDFYTAKYRGADGMLVWEKRYDGPANGSEFSPGPHGLALGPNRTVAIAGASDGNYVTDNTIYDFITILYRELAPPGIEVQPQSLSAECGTTNSFSVGVTGDAPFFYQWFFNSAPASPGGTSPQLFVAANSATAGNYFVVISNDTGSITSMVATLTVVDSTPPMLLGVPTNVIVDCNAVPLPANVTATDICDPIPIVTYSELRIPGSCPQSYALTRTWTARDASSNTASASQVIIVRDATAPTLSGQGTNQTIYCPATPVFSPPTAGDNCDPNPTITFTDTVIPGASPANYTITRTWRATDGCSNVSAAVSQTIVVLDITPPQFTCSTNMVVEFTGSTGTVVHFTLMGTDCDTNVAVTCVPPSDSTFPIGTTTVQCMATDPSGNSTSCEFTVTVLGARGVELNVLSEMAAASTSVTNRFERRRIQSAFASLTSATNSSYWFDDNHLVGKTGRHVFHFNKLTVHYLQSIVAQRRVSNDTLPLPDNVLLGWMDRLTSAKRLLAEIAIDEAGANGGVPQGIAACRRLLDRGDASGQPGTAINRYQEAWTRAIRLQAR